MAGTPQLIAEGTTYEEIYEGNKDLNGKIAGNDNPLKNGKLLGWGQEVGGINLLTIDYDGNGDRFIEPEDFVQGIFTVLAERAVNGEPFIADDGLDGQRISSAHVLPSGVDYAQLLQKFLHGSISFSQATSDYLSTDLGPNKGLNADNSQPSKPGSAFTAMEHHWDEAFGYFGAARDYLSYSDEQIAAGVSLDTDSSNTISLKSEVNFPLAQAAAKRDLGAAGATDYTTVIMTHFIEGRRLITEKPDGYRLQAIAKAQLAVESWEASLGATVVHYINRYLKSLESYGTAEYSFKDLAKFWSEMKGYGLSFQFNPKSKLSVSDFKKIHQLMGDSPVLPQQQGLQAYRKALKEARSILAKTYSFDDSLTEKW